MALSNLVKKILTGDDYAEGEEYEEESVNDRSNEIQTTTNFSGGPAFSVQATMNLSVQMVMPKRYEDVKQIAEAFKLKKTIVLNLEQTNKELAGRILDFISGVAVALDGKVKRTGENSYLVLPFNVQYTGELVDAIENGSVQKFSEFGTGSFTSF